MATDNTFSALDIFRIYSRNLTVAERQQVFQSICGATAPPFLTPFQMEALQLTKSEILDQFGAVDRCLIFLDLLNVREIAANLEWAQIETQQLNVDINELRDLLRFMDDEAAQPIPIFPRIAELIGYRAAVEGTIVLLETIRDALGPINTLFLIFDALDSVRVRLDSLQTTASIWAEAI